MKNIATTINGSTLAEITREELSTLLNLTAKTATLCRMMEEALCDLTGITMPGAPFDEPLPTPPPPPEPLPVEDLSVAPPEPLPVPPPAPAAKRSSKTQAKAKPKAQTGRDTKGVMIGLLRKSLADGIARDMDSIMKLVYAAGTLPGPFENLRYKVNVCLAGNKKIFERTAEKTYRLRPAGSPAVVIPKPSVTDKSGTIDNYIRVVDPSALTDEQLKIRMQQAKASGQTDKPARLEYIRRNSGQQKED